MATGSAQMPLTSSSRCISRFERGETDCESLQIQPRFRTTSVILYTYYEGRLVMDVVMEE
ncbi:hypothetical protein [Neomegalonema sp.]|uniref:hypothetical protein n=1 Tax=Neomegalonema sp. TaxID=2039713 RepID=UPI00261AB5A6|nr:hypothetical protein [Neomegalonema sp.]MDD2869430.1 hypothetical protein [Neomegalonema sp.]